MKTLYLECNMGAAGDMLTAALSELLPDPDGFVAAMNAAGIPEMRMSRGEKTSCGVRGTHISVRIGGAEEISDDVPATQAREHEHDHDHDHAHAHEHDHAHDYDHDHAHEHDHDHAHEHEHDHAHDHAHAGMAEVREIVARLNLPEEVKRDVMGVYALIGDAEARAHGCDVAQIHFHEVGMMDAIADVSAVCLAMRLIAPERVVVSPVCTGFGQVRCMHGVVPVPAPATAFLLEGMPAYAGRVRGELLTPTGAALLKYFADEYGQMPQMRVQRVGYGMGMKDFEAANCVRVFLGDAEGAGDEVCEICCNLDDMTGEAMGYATEVLMDAGALDVYLTAIQMKKGRPAVKLSCICRPDDAERMAEAMLRHTTSLGVRMQKMARRTMARETERVATPYGEMRVKIAHGDGFARRKLEYEDVARAARESGASLMEVQRAAERADGD